MPLIPGIEQHKQAWHDARSEGIGASESSCLFPLALPGYAMSQYTLAKVKRGEIPAESVFVGDKEFTERGLRMEPVIANELKIKYGIKLKKGGYLIDAKQPLMRASLDYIILEPTEMIRNMLNRPDLRGPGILQIKSVIPPQYEKVWDDHVPAYVRIQAQQEIACFSDDGKNGPVIEWGAVGIGIGNMDYRLFPMLGAEAFHNELRKKIASFWRKYVTGKSTPPVDHTQSTRLSLKREFIPRERQGGFDDMSRNLKLDNAAERFHLSGLELANLEREHKLAENQIRVEIAHSVEAMAAHWWIKRDKRNTIRVEPRMTKVSAR